MPMRTIVFDRIPISPLYDPPIGWDRDDLWTSGTLFYEVDEDEQIVRRPLVITNQGSGNAGIATESNLTGLAFYERGYAVLVYRRFSSRSLDDIAVPNGLSSPAPPGAGYGDNAAPMFAPLFAHSAYVIQSAIEFIGTIPQYVTDEAVYLMGHSAGATACIAWSAMSREFGSTERVAAIYVNGTTTAGLGTNAWNRVSGNISSITDLIRRAVHPVLYSWGTADSFAPPDLHRRMQASAIESGADAEFHFEPGKGHSWLDGNKDIWAPQVDSFFQRRKYLPQATQLIDRFASPPTPSIATIINNTVRRIVAAGLWDLLDVLQIYASADVQSGLLNWRREGGGSTAGAVTHTPWRHFQSDGAAGSYVNTGFAPSDAVAATSDSATFAVWSNAAEPQLAVSRVLGGVAVTGARSFISLNSGDITAGVANVWTQLNGSTSTYLSRGTLTTRRGLIGSIRRPDGRLYVHANTMQVGASGSIPLTGVPDKNIYLLGRNNDGVHGNENTHPVSAFVYGREMSTEQYAQLYTTINSYMTAVGNV